jgi:hypothetical protein
MFNKKVWLDQQDTGSRRFVSLLVSSHNSKKNNRVQCNILAKAQKDFASIMALNVTVSCPNRKKP